MSFPERKKERKEGKKKVCSGKSPEQKQNKDQHVSTSFSLLALILQITEGINISWVRRLKKLQLLHVYVSLLYYNLTTYAINTRTGNTLLYLFEVSLVTMILSGNTLALQPL